MGGPQRSAGGVAASARLAAARIDDTGCPTPATADGPTRRGHRAPAPRDTQATRVGIAGLRPPRYRDGRFDCGARIANLRPPTGRRCGKFCAGAPGQARSTLTQEFNWCRM